MIQFPQQWSFSYSLLIIQLLHQSIDKLAGERGYSSFCFLRRGYFCLYRLLIRLDSVDFGQWPNQHSALFRWSPKEFQQASWLFCQSYRSTLRCHHYFRNSNQRLEFKSHHRHQVSRHETAWSFAHSRDEMSPSDSPYPPQHGSSPVVKTFVGFLSAKEKKYFSLVPCEFFLI